MLGSLLHITQQHTWSYHNTRVIERELVLHIHSQYDTQLKIVYYYQNKVIPTKKSMIIIEIMNFQLAPAASKKSPIFGFKGCMLGLIL